MAQQEVIQWRCRTALRKYADEAAFKADDPHEVRHIDGNLLLYGGASAIWHRLIGGTSVTSYNSADAHIGVGDSTTAAAPGQTDLQAVTNKVRKPMDGGYPSHTEGTTSGSASVTFRATFGSSDANWAWQEWGLFNASSSGRMLNRKVASLGTKASGSVWVLAVTLSLA